MDHPYNFVVVGDNEKDAAKYNAQLQPIKLEENFGIAITSLFHGSIHNITPNNQEIIYELKLEVDPDDPIQGLPIPGNITQKRVRETVKMEEGNYGSTLAILKTIAAILEQEFPSDEADVERNRGRNRGGARNRARGYRKAGFLEETHSRSVRKVKPENPPRLEIDESLLDDNNEGFIYATPKNIKLVVEQNTPWKMMGINSDMTENRVIEIRNVIYSKTNQPAFLYSNIVENSYINGKLSRLLSIIPLHMKSHWGFYEFNKPVYVPIDVKQFSKIIFELRDINGKLITFDSKFKTILNLHIKPINRFKNKEPQF